MRTVTCGVSLGLDPTLLRCSPLGFVVPDTTCKKKEKKEKKKETETKTKTETRPSPALCMHRARFYKIPVFKFSH